MLYKSKYPFLRFNEMCQIEQGPFQTVEPDCVYYVCTQAQLDEGPTPIPIDRHMCADYYYPELIEYWLELGKIKMTDLRHKIRACQTISVKLFQELVEFIYSITTGDASMKKTTINHFIGCMKKSKTTKTTVAFTSCMQQILHSLTHMQSTQPLPRGQIMVINNHERNIMTTHTPVHQQILDVSQKYMGIVINELKNNGCDIVGVKTDCVYISREHDEMEEK